MEVSFRQALINTGSVQSLLASFVTRPISLVVLLLVIASFVLQAKVLNKMDFSPKTTNSKEEADE
jgi:TctA family transporter